MSPKTISFEREAVLEAALKIVRARGLDGLTARAVAGRLGASVAPVYRTFRSMEGLKRAVLESARRKMDDRTRVPFTDIPFLNIGVGIVVFAREEGRLFRALFHSRHHCQDILRDFQESVLGRMKDDAMLRLLPDVALQGLLGSIWLYTLGLATAVVYGHLTDTDTKDIVRRLRDMGNVLMFAEVAGIADSEGPANDREWERLIREMGIVLPSAKGCPPAAGRGERKEKP
jgi:AcrR family transcriptional regulator